MTESSLVELATTGCNEGVRVTVETRGGTWAMEGLMSSLDLRLMEGMKVGIEVRPKPDEKPRDDEQWLLNLGLVVTREEKTKAHTITPHGEQEHFKVYRWWTDKESQ